MPEPGNPPVLQEINLDEKPFRFEGGQRSDEEALSLVKKTFDCYSTYRSQNHDKRWDTNDKMYHGDVPQRYWKNSKEPRASLGIPIAFEHVESIYPILVRELFGQHPYWFDAEATPLSGPQEALDVRAALAYQFDLPWDASAITSKQHLKMTLRDLLQHGNGVTEVGWNPAEGHFFTEWVNLRDFYFSPLLATPIIDKSPAVIRRKFISVEEIEKLRGLPGFSVPGESVLFFYAGNKQTEQADTSKQYAASLLGDNFDPTSLQESDPAQRTVELLQFWSDKETIWIINRNHVLLNVPNPYGFKPFCMAPLYIVLGRAYAMSLPDILEGEQMYIQGITNSRLDELALALNPPRARKADHVTYPEKLAWYPGFVDKLQDAQDVTIQFPQNVTSAAIQEVLLSEGRARRRTGVSELIQSGTPTPSNANRTAGGVLQQAQSSAGRIQPIIEAIEDYLIVPLLYKAHAILNKFLPQGLSAVPGTNEQGQAAFVSRGSLQKPVKFRMVAGQKMVTRERLLQMLQPVSAFLFNEGVMKQATALGQTVDFAEWSRFFQEATGTAEKFAFFRPLNQQEQQAQQQPTPDQSVDMQKAQLESQTRLQMGQMKMQTEGAKIEMERDTRGDKTAEGSAQSIMKLLGSERLESMKQALQKMKEKEKPRGGGDKK